MTGPVLEAYRFGWACLLGLGLGVCYGFLRPLREKHPRLADFLFLPVLGYSWLYLGFAICRGDLRLAYTAGLFVGAWVWDRTLGRLLQPVFGWIWKLFGLIWGQITGPVRKILKNIQKNAKNLFARWKKWFTIMGTKRRYRRQKNGGVSNGKKSPLF